MLTTRYAIGRTRFGWLPIFWVFAAVVLLSLAAALTVPEGVKAKSSSHGQARSGAPNQGTPGAGIVGPNSPADSQAGNSGSPAPVGSLAQSIPPTSVRN